MSPPESFASPSGGTPLRIGLLAPPWVPVPPVGYGGTESVVDRLARGLERSGHEIRLWTTGDATCPVPRGATFDVAPTHLIGTASLELHHAIEAYQWFTDERCDVVHDHTLGGPFVATGPAPVITTNHGPFDNPELTAIYRRLHVTVPIIAISHHQASVAARLDIGAAHVIHHGIDVADVPVGRGRGDRHGPYLVFLGRMNRAKGLLEAIDVARATESRLVIAAKMNEPAERAFFEHHVAPRCGDGVEYLGEVGGIDKLRLIGEATALLNPIQWSEPFGLVMIEALATGTPVIVTRRGSGPEIVDHGRTGFVCDDHAALERAVREVDRIDRRNCRLDVVRRFSSQRMVARHVSAYRQLVASPLDHDPARLPGDRRRAMTA